LFIIILATKSLDTSNKTNGNITNSLQRSLVIQSSALFNNDENDLASIDWLKIYGIDAQKLDFHSALQAAAFKHCDGIVTLFKPPEYTNGKTNSIPAVRIFFILRELLFFTIVYLLESER
jgi:hypothetical protein